MDKLLNSTWFVKIIAFLLALMMYTVVSMETQEEANNRSLWTKIYKDSETLQNVELKPYFNQDKFELTDMPDSVDLTLTGSSRLITKATKVDKSLEAYIDLTNMQPGAKHVKVQVKNLPDGLKVKVNPQYVDVTLHKKVTKEFPVNVDLKNIRKLPEGYTPGDVEYSPKNVKVTGAEGLVKEISFITGFVDVGKANETIHATVPLRAYNQSGDLLDVQISPQVADVTVPIKKPQKTVPISVQTTGELKEGLAIKSITTDPSEVTLTGTSTALEKYDSYKELSIDLSSLTEDTTFTLDAPKPDGIEAVSDKKIKVTVDVDEVNVTKTFNDVPLTFSGIEKGETATFLNPSDGVVDITVEGKKDVIDSLKKNDLQGVVDVSNLSKGKHDVKIKWENPADTKLKDAVQEASVQIETETSSQ